MLNTVQTNPTLIDDEWAEFLAEHDFLIGVSIDGPRDMRNACPVDKGGKPTFDRVMAGLAALRRHDLPWNTQTTVNAANGTHCLEVHLAHWHRDATGLRRWYATQYAHRDPAQHCPCGRSITFADGHGVADRGTG